MTSERVPGLTKPQQEVVEAHKRNHPDFTNAQIAKQLGLTKSYVEAFLKGSK